MVLSCHSCFGHPQDSKKRSAIDADREDARLRRLAEEMVAQQERERQWRVARGTATAEDLRGPIRTGPAERDTWMTELPESRRPNAQPSQVNVVCACMAVLSLFSSVLKPVNLAPYLLTGSLPIYLNLRDAAGCDSRDGVLLQNGCC